MLRCIDWSIVTNIMEVHAAWIFRIRQSKKSGYARKHGYIIYMTTNGVLRQWKWLCMQWAELKRQEGWKHLTTGQPLQDPEDEDIKLHWKTLVTIKANQIKTLKIFYQLI